MQCPVCVQIVTSLKSRLCWAILEGYICHTEDRIRLQLFTECFSWNDSDTWKISHTYKTCLYSFIRKNSAGVTVTCPGRGNGQPSQTWFNPLFSWMERQMRNTDAWWLHQQDAGAARRGTPHLAQWRQILSRAPKQEKGVGTNIWGKETVAVPEDYYFPVFKLVREKTDEKTRDWYKIQTSTNHTCDLVRKT